MSTSDPIWYCGFPKGEGVLETQLHIRKTWDKYLLETMTSLEIMIQFLNPGLMQFLRVKQRYGERRLDLDGAGG